MKIQISSMSGAERALAAGGMGALAAMLGVPQVEAAVVISSGGAGATFLTNPAQVGTFQVAYWDMDGITTNGPEFMLGTVGPDFWISVWNSLSAAVGGGGYAQRFTATSLIPGHTAWAGPTAGGPLFNAMTGIGWSTSLGAPVSWQNGQGYIGVRIDLGGSVYDYGWVLVTPNTLGTTVTINNWLAVGAAGGGGGGKGGGAAGGGPGAAAGTPEPAAAGLGLLALGAAGVMRHKRRRKDKVA